MTNQPVPYLHMDAQQLETHRALMQTQSSVAELVSHLEEAKDVDVKVGALWGRDAQMLQTTVLSPTEMYKVAKQYGLDEQCLKIMSISGYTDPVVILSHWKRITETVLNSVGANKLEVLKAKVVNLAHEFNHASNRGYFPLSFVLEVLIRACLKSPAMSYELYARVRHRVRPSGERAAASGECGGRVAMDDLRERAVREVVNGCWDDA